MFDKCVKVKKINTPEEHANRFDAAHIRTNLAILTHPAKECLTITHYLNNTGNYSFLLPPPPHIASPGILYFQIGK